MLTSIILADVTTLRYRAFAAGLLNIPWIINTFITAEIAQGILSSGGWRWGYGMFIIMVPACLVPVIGALLWGQRKAKKMNMIQYIPNLEQNIFKHPIKGTIHACKQMDVCIEGTILSFPYLLSLITFSYCRYLGLF